MSILAELYKEQKRTRYITHETTICRNPHKSSNSDSHITRKLGYQQTLSKCCIHKKLLVLIFS